jgi:hypothetical protein
VFLLSFAAAKTKTFSAAFAHRRCQHSYSHTFIMNDASTVDGTDDAAAALDAYVDENYYDDAGSMQGVFSCSELVHHIQNNDL